MYQKYTGKTTLTYSISTPFWCPFCVLNFKLPECRQNFCEVAHTGLKVILHVAGSSYLPGRRSAGVYFLRCRACLHPRLAARGWLLALTASHLTQCSLQESKNEADDTTEFCSYVSK